MQRIALLESEKHGERVAGGSAASVALHVVVLAFAIAVTSHAGTHARRDEPLYIPLPHFQPEAPPVVKTAAPHAPTATPHVPRISVAVPSVIPPTLPAPTLSDVVPAAIGAPSVAVPGAAVGNDSGASVARGDVPFEVDEVDVAASVIGGQRGPVYPEAQRMMGVDGRVVARFIIGKNGRVESDPTIVSSTSDEFASSVRRYLAGARYRPATKNGEPVRQLAEQAFEFTVRR